MASKPPQTAREALIAEVLGDIDTILNRVDTIKSEVESLGSKQNEDFLMSANKATENLKSVTVEFQKVIRQNVDDFVQVANETLGKFTQRTNEIQSRIDRLEKLSITTVSQQQKKPPSKNYLLWWLLPTCFIVGVLSSIIVTMLLK